MTISWEISRSFICNRPEKKLENCVTPMHPPKKLEKCTKQKPATAEELPYLKEIDDVF